MKTLSILISFCLLTGYSLNSSAQPGSLDNTFGNGGIVIAPVSSPDEQGYEVAVQADNKIVIAGHRDTDGINDFALVRYNPDGSMDNTFGNGGVVIYDSGSDADMAWSMVLQDNGKILIGGSINNQFTTVDDFAMVRFNADGTPDNTFGSGGLVVTDFNGQWDNGYALAMQDDDKILFAGEIYSENKRNVGLIRYMPDGSLDASFGSGGIALKSIGSGDDRSRAVGLQADGKIIVAGFMDDGVDDQIFLTRFNTDGSTDNTFGNNGVATLDIGGYDDRCHTMIIFPNDKILIGGSNGTVGNNNYLLVKYLPDGTLDDTFGSNGMALNNFGINDLALDMVLQPDGKILTAGGAFTFELVRFMETGYPDIEFGNNGIVNTSIGTNFSISQALALQADGKIIVAGHSHDGTNYDFSLSRYHSEESGYIVDQDEIIKAVSVYPNPVIGHHITIEYLLSSDQELSVELLTAEGKRVQLMFSKQLRKAGFNTEFLNLPGDLASGLYFIRVSSTGGSSVIKLKIK